ncbi:SpoIIE family protein phosphatase [Kitasatospora sp. NBC_00240]|uniref:SpoIIE family protein phosphatase n=1 Tax=Kitasatospora sp. NBC_00240 TaxID=2903567 RepID=UPI002251964C|nr:SpoIIE family protein phosphatase [Kitasatospora sp. NBC_00240]MCX5214431.1 SpoIIE family protein phosphatase [Kitasatospora sp. NBC_00240]
MRQGVPADQHGPRETRGTRAERGDAHRRRAHVPAAAGHEVDVLLAAAVRKALSSTQAYGGVVYLHSRDRRSLVLTTVAGVPLSLLSPMRRIAVAGPLPAAVSYRTGRTVTLADTEDTMRRFPQLAVGMPYDFSSACVPIASDGHAFGVLTAFWPASQHGVPDRAPRHLRTIANRLGGALAGLESGGHPVEAAGDTAVIELPTPAIAVTRVGLFDWNLATGRLNADEEMCELFGVPPAEYDGRAVTFTDRIAPADLPELRAAARAALDHRRVLAARIRVVDHEGHAHPVELWGRVPDTGPTGRTHLVGAVLDSRTGTAAAAAVERLRDGVFSLDPDGVTGYVNRSCELLLAARREDLVGHHPWDVLPWLADPVYEDRYRAAMLSQQPTAFLALRPPDTWLAFSLYPDAHGVTGRVVAAEAPPGVAVPPVETPTLTRPGIGSTYHLLQLASALTEAVSVKEVCQAVGEQILPAFGGQQLAIYTAREKRLHLVSQTGYPDGFLDPFEGTPMGTRLPGVDALSTGTPIFFESVHQLSAAYPGIPLDEMRSWAFLPLIASGHPVGSCILGFDEPKSFSSEERGLLTALGGFIAQALERARLYDAEFALARGLQQALLPHRLPRIEAVRIVARYLPGTQGMEIGGDWYDAISTSCGACLVIGDVEGHNVGAAATMGQLRSAVRAFASGGDPPGEVLRRTNRLMVDLDPGLLASCCLIYLEPETGHACAARAGHLPPLLRHPDGQTEALHLPGGPLLGIDNQAEFPVTELDLAPGSILALYTDGLVEEPGSAIDEGVDRLRTTLAHAEAATLDELADRLLLDARRSTHRADDVALLLAAYTPD